MQTSQLATPHQPRSRVCFTILLLFSWIAQTHSLFAPPQPAWWETQLVVDSTHLADDYTAVNIGQLKAFSKKAASELRAALGDEGSEIANLIQTWDTPAATGVVRDDYTAVNVGMLKNIVSKFYDRLRLARANPALYPYAYPWPIVEKVGCTVTTGNTSLTLPSTTGIAPGRAIFGPGIPSSAVVASITSNTQLILSVAPTGTFSNATCLFLQPGAGMIKTGSSNSGGDVLTLASTAGLKTGMAVHGEGLPNGRGLIKEVMSDTELRIFSDAITTSSNTNYFFHAVDDYALVNLGQLKNAFSFSTKLVSDPVPLSFPISLSANPLFNAAKERWDNPASYPRSSTASSTDYDGDGIPNDQEYWISLLLGGLPPTYFEANDSDGDRILNPTEDLWNGISPPVGDTVNVLNKLLFHDAVADFSRYDLASDGVMNYEELRLGLDPARSSTIILADGRVRAENPPISDTLVLAWGLLHGSSSLSPSTDAVQDCWAKLLALPAADQTAWFASMKILEQPGWLLTSDGADPGSTPDGLDAFRVEAPALLATALTLKTENWITDHDGDGMSDGWEYRYGLDPRSSLDKNLDPDRDGLSNLAEYNYGNGGSNPLLFDSDGDGFSDKGEKDAGTNAMLFTAAASVPVKIMAVSPNPPNRFIGLRSDAMVIMAHKGGIPQPAVPVTFSITNTDSATWGKIESSSGASSTSGTLLVSSDSNGLATVTVTGYKTGSITLRAASTVNSVTTTVYFSFIVEAPSSAITSTSGNYVNLGGGAGGRDFIPAQNQKQADQQFPQGTNSAFNLTIKLGPAKDEHYLQTSALPFTSGRVAMDIWDYDPKKPTGGWDYLTHSQITFNPPTQTNPNSSQQQTEQSKTFIVIRLDGPGENKIPWPLDPKEEGVVTTALGTVTFTLKGTETSITTTATNCEAEGNTIKFTPPAAEKNKSFEMFLLPVEIKRDIAGGEEKWESITGKAAKILPGQKANLKLELPAGITASDFNWTMTGGKFKNYSEPLKHNDARKVPLESSDLKNEQVHFYWSQPGSQTVTVNCMINGSRQFIRQTIEVVAPTSTLTGVQNKLNTGPGFLWDNNCTWQGTLNKLTTDFPEGGEWMFVQLIQVDQLIEPSAGPPNKINEFNGEWCLDTRPDIIGVSFLGRGKKSDGENDQTGDGPRGGAAEDGNERLDHNWKTYIMFKSKEAEARWVPLRVMEWSMGFRTTISWSGVSFNGAHPTKNRNLTGSETHIHPEWDKITSFLVKPQ